MVETFYSSISLFTFLLSLYYFKIPKSGYFIFIILLIFIFIYFFPQKALKMTNISSLPKTIPTISIKRHIVEVPGVVTPIESPEV